MENYGGIYAHTTTRTYYTQRCAYATNTCTQHSLPIYTYTFTICVYCRYVYRIIIGMCVFFRSGDEFLRDVRPDRTNRAFLILLLLFYARALHILCLNYTAVGRTRCGPALPSSDKTYDRSRRFSLYYIFCVMMVPNAVGSESLSST